MKKLLVTGLLLVIWPVATLFVMAMVVPMVAGGMLKVAADTWGKE